MVSLYSRVNLTPSSLRIKCGEEIRLTAQINSNPIAEVNWFKEEERLLADARISMFNVDVDQVLLIENACQEDTGCYSFILHEDHNNFVAFSSVTVEGVPGVPMGQPEAYSIGTDAIILSWYGPSYDGGSPVTAYKLEIKRPNEDWSLVSDSCQFTSYNIYNLEEKMEYIFRVSCCNVHGFSQPGAESNPILTLGKKFNNNNASCKSIMLSPILVSGPVSPSTIRSAKDLFNFTPKNVEIKTKNFHDFYTISDQLGRGKFGSVYKCQCKATGEEFAAKILRRRSGQESCQRNEVAIMNCLRHACLLLLWDAYEMQREFVLVMELVKGHELLDRVTDEDYILTERECVHFLRQICEGVDHMHRLHIAHLDLKPENILCVSDNSNQIKIIDFGLARQLVEGEVTKVLVGTAEFVAPEIVNFERIDVKTDMWSVGVITYVLLTGISPFCGDSEAETLSNVTMASYEFDEDLFSSISKEAINFISNLLVKNIKLRKSCTDCLTDEWLSQDVTYMRAIRISTKQHKKFLAKRKWQKSSNAILAVKRLTLDSKQKSFSHSDISSDIQSSSPTTFFTSPLSSLSLAEDERRNSLPYRLPSSKLNKMLQNRDLENLVQQQCSKKNIGSEEKTIIDADQLQSSVNNSQKELKATSSIFISNDSINSLVDNAIITTENNNKINLIEVKDDDNKRNENECAIDHNLLKDKSSDTLTFSADLIEYNTRQTAVSSVTIYNENKNINNDIVANIISPKFSSTRFSENCIADDTIRLDNSLLSNTSPHIKLDIYASSDSHSQISLDKNTSCDISPQIITSNTTDLVYQKNDSEIKSLKDTECNESHLNNSNHSIKTHSSIITERFNVERKSFRDRKSAYLKSVETPHTTKKGAHFIRTLKDQSTKLNEEVTLSVTIGGWPKPSISWFKDDLLLRPPLANIDFLEKERDKYFIKIKCFGVADMGVYTCQIENELACIKSSARITLSC